MFLNALRQDVNGAIRGLWKSPGFAIAALVTLALGIGAPSAIFSVVSAVLLTPLPYDAPERRVMLWSKWVNFDKTWVSSQEVADYRNGAKTLTNIAFWDTGFQNLTGGGDPVRLGVGLVSANTFEVLGRSPLAGRTFTAEEDRPNGPRVAVLSYPLWQARFAGDFSVLGRTILLNDIPVEVIGVMPQGFRLPTDFTVGAAEPTQLWRPLQIDSTNLNRDSHAFYAAAVLAPGQSAATATAELQAIARRLTEGGQYPESMQFSAFAVDMDQEIRGEVRPALSLLMVAVGFLLLIACVNVANLLLVRGDARLREMALRTAIGAAPNRLVRQLLTESVVLSFFGGLLALATAWGALRILTIVGPAGLPAMTPVKLDGTVVAFTLTLALVTTLLFGLAPALRALHVNLVESFRQGGQNTTPGVSRQHLRAVLVTTEVALAVVLVIGAGLMIRSLSALGDIDLGFNPQHALTMRVEIPTASYDTPEKTIAFYRQLLERVNALPGVESAGVVRSLPLATTIGDSGVDVDGFVESPGRNAKGDWQVASDGAFEALGSRLVRGRWFAAGDNTSSVPVAVVNETMARAYWPDGNAVAGRIRIGNIKNPWVDVVGIVGDERHNGVTAVVKEKYFIPHTQWHVVTGGSPVRSMFVVARTTGDPITVAGAVRAELRQLDSSVPVANTRPMTEVVAASLATPRLAGFLLGAFALIALALAAVGIYGVLAYLVSQRRQEIGIRLAIGADRAQVLRMILRQGMTLASIGIVAGLAASMLLTSLMQSLLYQVGAGDPVTFVIVPVIILLIALTASLVPALRAMRVSPLIALRTQ